MEFKGTKGRLNITDNGNGQIAIYGEDLKALAFIPKHHDESDEYLKLFKAAPDLLEACKIVYNICNKLEMPTEFEVEAIKNDCKKAIEKALK